MLQFFFFNLETVTLVFQENLSHKLLILQVFGKFLFHNLHIDILSITMSDVTDIFLLFSSTRIITCMVISDVKKHNYVILTNTELFPLYKC